MGKIEHILYGEDSCFVLYKNENGADSDCILPKTAAGYPLSTRWTKQGIVRTPITSSSFLRAEVYQARGTQDFYIYCEKFRRRRWRISACFVHPASRSMRMSICRTFPVMRIST